MIDEIADKEAFLESVREGFLQIEATGAKDNQNHPLVDLLVVILCAVLAGANTITDIHTHAQVKIGMFQQLLQMSTAPSYDVFWWLLTRLHPRQIEGCFVRWIQSLPDEDKTKLIAIDGKNLRATASSRWCDVPYGEQSAKRSTAHEWLGHLQKSGAWARARNQFFIHDVYIPHIHDLKSWKHLQGRDIIFFPILISKLYFSLAKEEKFL